MGTPYVWSGTNAVAAIRDTVGDPVGATTTRMTDATIVGYLNRAMLQVVLDCERSLETSWTFTLVASQREYSMHAAFYKVARVEYIFTASTDIRRLEPMTRNQYDTYFGTDEGTTDEPRWYYFWRKLGTDPTSTIPPLLFLHPTPGSGENGKTVRVTGFKYPDAVSSSDLTKVLELEAPYVEAAVLWAAMLIATDENDDGRAASLEARYERQVNKVRQSQAQKVLSAPSRLMPRNSRLMLGPHPWALP